MRQLRIWLGVFTGWTALALFFAVSSSLTYRSTGRPGNWALSIERSLLEWWLWALLTPVVVWLARRFSFSRRRWMRALVVHVAAGIVIAVVKTQGDRAGFAWLTGMKPYLLVSTVALQFSIYLAIVAAAHGLVYYERSRERDHLAARLADARLQLLSMQLQPHFLFNTLNTIAELVHDDPDGADRMIASLSDLLRKTLELGPAQEIPLGAELELLERYLDIQRARFGDRLRVGMTVGDDARAAAVPVLLLQPIVENAIRHGLAEHIAAGRIHIDAHRQGDRLVITVEDDGPGLPAAAAPHKERVGLGNTRARLEALYGTDHRLELTNAVTRGARVSLEIPFKTAVVT
ncbi:MAG TPA: histidine kinase [Vicinamibacterales bacterium]|nr:histidine kinase [Vicinamibacterales bacterium]